MVASASLGSVAPAPAPPSHTMNHLMEALACLATRRPRTRRGQPQPQQEEGRPGPVRGRRSRLQHSSTPHHHEVGVAAGRYRDRYTSVRAKCCRYVCKSTEQSMKCRSAKALEVVLSRRPAAARCPPRPPPATTCPSTTASWGTGRGPSGWRRSSPCSRPTSGDLH